MFWITVSRPFFIPLWLLVIPWLVGQRLLLRSL
jgi:hypothetical protein